MLIPLKTRPFPVISANIFLIDQEKHVSPTSDIFIVSERVEKHVFARSTFPVLHWGCMIPAWSEILMFCKFEHGFAKQLDFIKMETLEI